MISLNLSGQLDAMGVGVVVRNRIKAEVRAGSPCRRQSQLQTRDRTGRCLERRDLVGIKNMLSYVLSPIKWARKCVMQLRISI